MNTDFPTAHSANGQAVTDLILEVFRFNGQLVSAGDRLVADLGLSSARWQILGCIEAAERPQPVAWLARDLGNSRQAVQRIVNELEKEGLVAFAPNPHHRRAPLIVLTEHGKQIHTAALQAQIPWANHLAAQLSVDDINLARNLLSALRQRLANSSDSKAD
jgi:DNA-binding MarR family transcriptional regulator